MQEARKAMGVKTKHLAINKTIQCKIQYEDEQKYSTTSEYQLSKDNEYKKIFSW